MPYDLFGEYFEYPKGKRKPGMVDKIRKRLSDLFPHEHFEIRLNGWGEKRGHILVEIAWDVTVYANGSEYPSERFVRDFLDNHLGAVANPSDLVFDLKPRRKDPIEHPDPLGLEVEASTNSGTNLLG
jgi:hypothetical protein